MRVFKIMKLFLLSHLRHFDVWFFIFAFPVVLFVIFSSIFSSFEGGNTLDLKVGIYKEEELSGLAKMIFSFVEKGEFFKTVNITDLEEGETLLKDKKLDGLIIFHKGFSRDLLSSLFGKDKKAILEIYVRSGSENSKLFESIMKSIISEINSKISTYGKKDVKVSVEEVTSSKKFKFKNYYFPGILIGSVFSAAMFMILPLIIFNRYTGVNRRIFITPTKPLEFFFGFMLSVFLLMLISVVLLYMIGFLMKVDNAIYSFKFVLLLLYSIVISTTFALMLATFVKYPQSANILGNLFYFLFTFLGGLYFNVYNLPKPLNFIVLLNPLTHIVEMMRNQMGMKFTPYPFYVLLIVPLIYLFLGIILFIINYKKVMGYE